LQTIALNAWQLFWDEFAVLSETDQNVIAMAADLCADLDQVLKVASAAQFAKAEAIKISLLDASSRIVAQALSDPAKGDAAKRMAQQLITSGLARPLLSDALAKVDR